MTISFKLFGFAVCFSITKVLTLPCERLNTWSLNKSSQADVELQYAADGSARGRASSRRNTGTLYSSPLCFRP